eukprot:1303292-Prymnesium_polylepis.1
MYFHSISHRSLRAWGRSRLARDRASDARACEKKHGGLPRARPTAVRRGPLWRVWVTADTRDPGTRGAQRFESYLFNAHAPRWIPRHSTQFAHRSGVPDGRPLRRATCYEPPTTYFWYAL